MTKLEYKYLGSYLNSKDFVDPSYFHKFEYKDGLLINSVSSNKDSTISAVEFEYTFDDQKRIIKIKQIEKNKNKDLLEEIEYFEDGKKSTLYFFQDNTKKKYGEISYDGFGKILTHNLFRYGSPNSISLNEYFYNKNGLLECTINGPYISIQADRHGEVSLPTGTYSIYKYDKDGYLNKRKNYELIEKTTDEETTYWKGNLKSKFSYSRKKKDIYTLHKTKYISRGKKINNKPNLILDHMNNKIVSLVPSLYIGGLQIFDITYYDK